MYWELWTSECMGCGPGWGPCGGQGLEGKQSSLKQGLWGLGQGGESRRAGTGQVTRLQGPRSVPQGLVTGCCSSRLFPWGTTPGRDLSGGREVDKSLREEAQAPGPPVLSSDLQLIK